MKITERSGSLSTNDGKRPTRNTVRTFFAKWGRADVVSLPELLSSNRSVELLGLEINMSERKIYVHPPNNPVRGSTAPSWH